MIDAKTINSSADCDLKIVRVCNVAGYHKGLWNKINKINFNEFLGFREVEGLTDKCVKKKQE